MPFELPFPWQFHGIISTIGPMDILDIIIVAVILYKVYVMLQDTRAITLVKGILVLLGVTIVCSWLELHVISWLLQKAVTLLFVALPIVFQPELRKIFLKIGQSDWLRIGKHSKHSHLDSVLTAAEILSNRRRGMLAVFTRRNGL